MTDKPNAIKEEIDLFDFIEILIKRKYVILSITVIAVFFALIYIYAHNFNAPRSFIIETSIRGVDISNIELPESFKVLNQKLNISKRNYENYSKKWFQTQAYKPYLQDNQKILFLPDIIFTDGGHYYNLKMIYPDAEQGVSILTEVIKALLQTEKSQNIVKTVNGLLNHEKDLLQIELDTITKNYYRKKLFVDSLISEEKGIDEKISELGVYLNALKEKIKRESKVDNNSANVQIIRENMEMTNQFIKYLSINASLLEYLKKITYDDLLEIGKKQKIKQLHFNMITEKIEKSKIVFDYDKVYFKEFYSKRLPKKKIIGLSTIVGGFIGIFIAFILEMRKRRLINRE